MRRRTFAALLGLNGALVVAAWLIIDFADLATSDADPEPGGVSVVAKGASPVFASVPVHENVDAVANPTIVDTALLDPHPILSASALAWLATLRPPAVQRFADEATGALQWSPAVPAVKNAIVVPRLDKEETLTLAHIAQIKASLDLTPDQERHWPALEAELREVVQRFTAQKANGKKPAISAADAQRLYWAAGPLVLSLRPDQKEELRRLARAMGLDQVASLL